MKTYHDLPAPTEEANARSLALRTVMHEVIRQHNASISFADFMELALYHPQYGYYQQPHFALGKAGDFTTAPEISPLFAHCFARQCQQIFQQAGEDNILELGAGSGRFALDLLTQLESLSTLPKRYYIYEISQNLRDAQRALIQSTRPDFLERIEWLIALPKQFSGVIIANEVLDALPFQCFQIESQHIKQRMVAVEEGQFIWQLAKPQTPELATALGAIQNKYALSDGYQSEIQLAAMSLVGQLCDALTDGVILFADYGYGQREYYHPQRNHGSMTCFYQHHALQDPFQFPGLQDITTHIDFTRTIETAVAHGAQLLGFTTQSAFLFANGLMDEASQLEQQLDERGLFQLHQAIKTFTLPTEMGDTVKVMALGRNINISLTGFSLLDRRRDL